MVNLTIDSETIGEKVPPLHLSVDQSPSLFPRFRNSDVPEEACPASRKCSWLKSVRSEDRQCRAGVRKTTVDREALSLINAVHRQGGSSCKGLRPP